MSLNFSQIYRSFYVIFVDILKNWIIIIIRMDTKNDTMTVKCGSMGVNRHDRLLVGAKQIRKALNAGKAQKVFLAKNADPAITDFLEALCREKRVEYVWVKSMTDLGKQCGIEVGAAAAALVS